MAAFRGIHVSPAKHSYAWLPRQTNSKNCGPPPGNKFDLEVGQRSRSPHGTNRKGLSQGSCMPNINVLSLIPQKIWARLKFLWQTDGRTDRQTDEWDLMSPAFEKGGVNVPRFRERRGTKMWLQDRHTDRRTDRQMPDKVIPICRYASKATQKLTLKWIKGHNMSWCQLKGLVKRIMHTKYQCTIIILQKILARLKFLWQKKRQSNRRTIEF